MSQTVSAPLSEYWSVFRLLCEVLGGSRAQLLTDSLSNGMLPQLVDMAQRHDVAPTLAVHCERTPAWFGPTHSAERLALHNALRDNTVRNMAIVSQALKIARILNASGIRPMFLKGTARLLATDSKQLGERKQVDIDLVVEPGQLREAAALLLQDDYEFCEVRYGQAVPLRRIPNLRAAFSVAGAHHHLPELIKPGAPAIVELHRHHLPARFQRRVPLASLFASAVPHESHGAAFLVPSTEHGIVHLVLGKLVHEGHFARHTFPLREACDYIHCLESARGPIDYRMIHEHCGRNASLFAALVAQLMAYARAAEYRPQYATRLLDRRIRIMQKACESRWTGEFFHVYARLLHLLYSAVYSPGKIKGFVFREAGGNI